MTKRRRDGRTDLQIRPLAVEFSVLKSSDGSARFAAGDTKVIVSVQGPRPPRIARLENPDKAVLEIFVLPATGVPGTLEAFIEGSIRAVFEAAIITTLHPRSVITIVIQILHDDGSLLACAINATTLALSDAGVPLRGIATACTAFSACPEPCGALDPVSEEEISANSSHTVAITSDNPSQVLLQYQYGVLPERERTELQSVALAGCSTSAAFLRLALRRKVEKEPT